jgi:hypothetical protein
MKLSAGVPLICAFAALALASQPAVAATGDEWQRLGAAPGGESFIVNAGTPYVARSTSKGVRVFKLVNVGKWRQVGSAVRHGRAKFIGDASLVSGPGDKLWLTWVQGPGPGGSQVRVARFSKGKWREVVGGKNPISPPHPSQGGTGRPFYSSYNPSLGFLNGRAYVAYADYDTIDTMIKVSRLGKKSRSWQRVQKGLGEPTVSRPQLANVGEQLYLVYRENQWNGAPVFRRFDAANSNWKALPRPQSSMSALFGGVVGFQGRLNALFAEHPAFSETPDGDVFVSALGSDDQWSHVGPALARDPAISPQSISTDGATLYVAYAQTVDGKVHLDVFAFDGTSWIRQAAPTPEGSTADSGTLAGAAGGGVWLLAHEKTGGETTFQLELLNAAE